MIETQAKRIVYVVTLDDGYDHNDFIGVFSTRVNAEAYVKRFSGEYEPSLDIDEAIMDEKE